MSEHAEAHAHPNYLKIWGILVVLLIISVVGPFLGIQVVTLITAFGIAIVKAYMVARNFMHVNAEPRYVVYLLLVSLAIMGLLFFFVAPDVMRHSGSNWVNYSAMAVTGETSGREAPPVQEEFDAGKTFAKVCSACHGTSGMGDGPAAIALDPKPANFNEPKFWETRTKDDVIKVIRDGGPSVGKSVFMAAYGSSYSAEQIDALAEVVMSHRPGAGDADGGE